MYAKMVESRAKVMKTGRGVADGAKVKRRLGNVRVGFAL